MLLVKRHELDPLPRPVLCAGMRSMHEGQVRRIARWEHEFVVDVVQARLEGVPEAMRLRRRTVEHVFGRLKAWMGSSHSLTKTLPRVSTEMSLQALADNLKRAIKILGAGPLMAAIKA